jgi:outer membrane immunogenic protein
MKRCSETIGKALQLRGFLSRARCPGASGSVRVGRIVSAAVLLSLAIALPAAAADMPIPGPAPVPPNSYYPAVAPLSWGGIYFGVNGGYGFGKSHWDNAGVSTGNFNTTGGLVGGTAGLNYVGFGGGFMVGVEGDLDWSGLTGSSSTAGCVGLGAAAGTTCQTKSGWLSTARVRMGYAFDRVLIFGTAGAALADFRAGLNPGSFISLGPQVGWTAGGGLEFALTENWTAKVEYLFVGLGTIACPSGTVCALTPPAGVSNPSISLNENVVRAGVNYRFNW